MAELSMYDHIYTRMGLRAIHADEVKREWQERADAVAQSNMLHWAARMPSERPFTYWNRLNNGASSST